MEELICQYLRSSKWHEQQNVGTNDGMSSMADIKMSLNCHCHCDFMSNRVSEKSIDLLFIQMTGITNVLFHI